jgi:phosphoglycolate phosphatase
MKGREATGGALTADGVLPAESRPMFVVFDLDGTLIDSIGDLVVAVNQLVAERGGRLLRDDEVSKMVGEGANLLIARAFDASGARDDPGRALSRFLEIYDGVLPGSTRPYPGVPEMLHALEGAAQMAVLTNKPTDVTRRILSIFGLERYFRGVIGGDGPFCRKPSPDGLLHLIADSSADPGRTLMVGDSTVDLRTAQAAATRACMVRYGFGFAAFDRAQLRGGEVFVDHPSEVAAFVLGQGHGG